MAVYTWTGRTRQGANKKGVLEASDKEARAKIRIAEGVQAEEAALGLAEVRVKEAEATAIEKQGLAEVKVRAASVDVMEREGKVEAEVIKEKHLAEATGVELGTVKSRLYRGRRKVRKLLQDHSELLPTRYRL